MGIEDILFGLLKSAAKDELKRSRRRESGSSKIEIRMSSPDLPEWKYKANHPEEYFDRFDEQPYGFYADAVDEIKRLKREKRHEEAEDLLLWCIDFAEWRAELYQTAPPGRYYKHLAIIRRKEEDIAGEVKILDRYVEVAGEDANDSLVERLDKARAIADRVD